jgi:hypothetical protein|nr:DUF6674 family protein [uncultured Schaedlerella sp.]
MEELLSIPLKEQDNFKELLRLLDEKGLHEEKGQVIHLADYIDNMDQQFGKVLKELQAVKHQVRRLEQRGLRQAVLRTVGKIEAKVHAAKMELLEFKDHLIDGVNRTIAGFKQKGILSVYKTIDFLGIKNGLLGVKRHLHQSMETADRGIASLGNIGDEMYGVRTHLGNIKRELAGKEPVTVGSREMERGAVFQMQKMLYGTMGILDQMEKRTDQTIQRLDSFGERVQGIQRPSLEGTVQENRRPSQSGRIQENHMPSRNGRAQENRESSQSRRNQEIQKPSVRGSLKAIQSESREAGQKVHRRAKLAVR